MASGSMRLPLAALERGVAATMLGADVPAERLLLWRLGERPRSDRGAPRRCGDLRDDACAEAMLSSSSSGPSSWSASSATCALRLDVARMALRLRLRAAASCREVLAKTSAAGQARKSLWLRALPRSTCGVAPLSGPMRWRELFISCPSSWTKVVCPRTANFKIPPSSIRQTDLSALSASHRALASAAEKPPSLMKGAL